MSSGTDAPAVPVRRVLVVDDSLSIQQAVREALAEIPGIQVIACGDVDSAESILAREKPDLVLCDVVLPGRPGYDLCRQITLGKRGERPPVFLLSGIFEPFDEERARAAGADDVITKPFRAEEIRQLMEKIPAPSAKPEGTEPTPPEGEPLDISAADLLPGQLPGSFPPMPQPAPSRAAATQRDGSGTDELVRRLIEPLTQRLVEPVVAGLLRLLENQKEPAGNALDEALRETVERVVRQRLRELEAEPNQGTGRGSGAPSPD
ncbi:MAG: response regulator [Acidobacteria bacterium]|nr:response regulator [Acidobacteriota bacterium]